MNTLESIKRAAEYPDFHKAIETLAQYSANPAIRANINSLEAVHGAEWKDAQHETRESILSAYLESLKPDTYGAPKWGCYFDHSYQNDAKLSVRIIELAVSLGWIDPEAQALSICEANDWLNDDASEALSEASEDAINWLNEKESRPFLSWSNSGEVNAFGLWPNVESAKEDCAFVSCKDAAAAKRLCMDCDPEDPSYPEADFRGEWLHVSDHGNCTLYVRENENTGKPTYFDREIWSLV